MGLEAPALYIYRLEFAIPKETIGYDHITSVDQDA